MGRRALIIGIEDYPVVADGSIASRLEGTLKSAEDFRDWLLEKWNTENVPEAERQIIFCSAPAVAGGRGAAAEDISQALLDLKAAGQNATEEFFLYFSGHGFSFVEPDARSDVLIASNYKSMQISGSACMKLDKAIYWLRQHLGIGHQYYFVDACRNDLDGRQFNPGGIIPPSDPQVSGEATTYLLQSTSPAATAAVDGKFALALLDGLKGRGTAKTWDETEDDSMIVRFDTLRVFVRARMTAQRIYNIVAGADGETDGILSRLRPAPPSTCTVRISGDAPVSGMVSSTGKRSQTRSDTPISGAATTVVLKPDRYRIEVSIADGRLQDNVRDVVVFDDTELTFDRAAPGRVARLEIPGAAAEIGLPKDLTVELQDLATGNRQVLSGVRRAMLPLGSYATVLRDAQRGVLKTEDLIVDAGSSPGIADWTGSPPHLAIAQRFPVDAGSILFSESIGPLADPDLAVWLAIVGGGRIMSGAPLTHFSKIAHVPLHDFGRDHPDSSPVYVLAGFEDPATNLEVMVSSDPERRWKNASNPVGPGIRECVIPLGPASIVVSFRLNGGAATSIVSATFAGFATMLTVTPGTDGRPSVAQYILPLGSRLKSWSSDPESTVPTRNMLADLRLVAEAQRGFRRRRDLRKALPGFWKAVCEATWTDPIGSAMAAYELLRRSDFESQRDRFETLLQRLQDLLPDFPDIDALRRLADRRNALSSTGVSLRLPLFLDGVLAVPAADLPVLENRIDYESQWTSWRGEVL